MDVSFRRFWWGKDYQNTKAFTPKSWKSICQEDWVSKTAHSSRNPSSLSMLGTSRKLTDFWFWKGLLKQRDFIKSSYCFQINNSTTARAWLDPWIPTLQNHIPQPNPNNHTREPNLKVAELTLEESRRWNTILLHALFSNDTVNEIQKTLFLTITIQQGMTKSNGHITQLEIFLSN